MRNKSSKTRSKQNQKSILDKTLKAAPNSLALQSGGIGVATWGLRYGVSNKQTSRKYLTGQCVTRQDRKHSLAVQPVEPAATLSIRVQNLVWNGSAELQLSFNSKGAIVDVSDVMAEVRVISQDLPQPNRLPYLAGVTNAHNQIESRKSDWGCTILLGSGCC